MEIILEKYKIFKKGFHKLFLYTIMEYWINFLKLL